MYILLACSDDKLAHAKHTTHPREKRKANRVIQGNKVFK